MMFTVLFRGSALIKTLKNGATAIFLLIAARYFTMSQDSSFQSFEVIVQDPYSFIRSSKGLVPRLLIVSVSKHDE